jgi:nicotinamide-nucleotide amidase
LKLRAEVVAVGTELLLGQVVDTNSAWIGEALAEAGIDSHFQTRVGDNRERIVQALRAALARGEAVIVCGGLGPTPDDITREAIAEVMNAPLVRDPALLERIRAAFGSRGRDMASNNARQADVPEGAVPIVQQTGTAPGLICPIGRKVLYAVPGVPHEMKEMVERAVIPDLQSRAGDRAVILSRTLRTWGLAESTLAEALAPRIAALEDGGGTTIAFLASGIEGIKVRITAKAPGRREALALLESEEAEVRALLGPAVFGLDDETMEHAVGKLLSERGMTLSVAESLTGGLVASRIVNVPGASSWFRGGIVSYSTESKRSLLGMGTVPAVSEEAAVAMAEGVVEAFGSEVGVSVTGVAGPNEQEGVPVGTVWMGFASRDGRPEAVRVRLPGDRERVRQFAAISVLDALRRRLLGERAATPR